LHTEEADASRVRTGMPASRFSSTSKTTKGDVMFAIFKKRASKFLADMAALQRKEVELAHRAKDHIEASYQVINTLYQEIDDAQLVIDEIEGRY
jgi:hypothetical protein